MTQMVTAADGRILDLDSSEQSFVYNGDGTLNYILVNYRTDSYKQTYTYVSGRLTNVSKWIKQ